MSGKSGVFPWNTLGLDGPASDKQIRKAYASELKALDRQADPEAFQALRHAYEFARQMAADNESDQVQSHRDAIRPEPPEVEEGKATAEDDTPKRQEPVSSTDHNDTESIELPGPVASAAAYQDLLARMRYLIESRDYDVTTWTSLLNDRLLDDLSSGHDFERALVICLSENEFSGRDEIKKFISAGKEWVELIERRYGWIEDGLKFERQFPAHMKLRRAMVAKREILNGDGQKATVLVQTPSVPFDERVVNLVLQPKIVWSAFAAACFAWIRVFQPSESMFIVGPVLLAIGSLFAFGWVFKRFEQPVVTLSSLGNWKLAFLGKYLVGRGLAHLVVGVFAWACFLTMCVFLFAPTEAPRNAPRIHFHDTDRFARVLRQLDTEGENGRLTRHAKQLISEYDPKSQSVDEFLTKLGTPYPLIAFDQFRDRYDIEKKETWELDISAQGDPSPVRAKMMVSCRRTGRCSALIETGALIQVEALAPHVNIISRRLADTPIVQLRADEGDQKHLEPSVLFDTKMDFIVNADTGKLKNWFNRNVNRFSFETLEATAKVTAPTGESILTLTVGLAKPGEIGWRVKGCVASVLSHFEYKPVFEINQNKDALVEDLCSVREEQLILLMRACPQPPGAERTLCPRRTLPVEYERAENSSSHALRTEYFIDPSVPAVHDGVFQEVLDTDGDRFVLAFLDRWSGRTPRMDASTRRKRSEEISDQIIRDYLTVFWNTTLPDSLASYLVEYPEIHDTRTAPTEHTLKEAVRRQPQLTRYYRVDEKAAHAILVDMFAFLSRMKMLRHETIPMRVN